MATIEELEADCWPDPGAYATYLVRRCWQLRRAELADFSVEDLRIMLGQRIAVAILLPRAIRVLVETPLAEGDFYPGDLLRAVIRLPDASWHDLRVLRCELADVLAHLLDSAGALITSSWSTPTLTQPVFAVMS